MAYCTVAEVKAMFDDATLAGMTDEDGTGLIDNDTITSAIETADGIIDGYLASRYTVPLSAPIPGLVNLLSADIAVYRLYVGHMVTRMTDAVRQMYEDAIAALTKLSKGEIMLPAVTPDGANSFLTNKVTTDRVFSSTLLAGF